MCEAARKPFPSYRCFLYACSWLRPQHRENTGSRPITEVKLGRARLVLGWETAWESRVLQPFCWAFFAYFSFLLVFPTTSLFFQVEEECRLGLILGEKPDFQNFRVIRILPDMPIP